MPVRPAPAETQSPKQRPAPYTLPPAILAKASTVTRLRTLLDFGGTAWTILVLLLVLALRWPAVLRNWAERITPKSAGSRDSSFSPSPGVPSFAPYAKGGSE
jgi:hypothetical protein